MADRLNLSNSLLHPCLFPGWLLYLAAHGLLLLPMSLSGSLFTGINAEQDESLLPLS